MLTLTRKEGESIILTTATGERIRVMLSLLTEDYRARISIEAPQSVTIVREELDRDTRSR